MWWLLHRVGRKASLGSVNNGLYLQLARSYSIIHPCRLCKADYSQIINRKLEVKDPYKHSIGLHNIVNIKLMKRLCDNPMGKDFECPPEAYNGLWYCLYVTGYLVDMGVSGYSNLHDLIIDIMKESIQSFENHYNSISNINSSLEKAVSVANSLRVRDMAPMFHKDLFVQKLKDFFVTITNTIP